MPGALGVFAPRGKDSQVEENKDAIAALSQGNSTDAEREAAVAALMTYIDSRPNAQPEWMVLAEENSTLGANAIEWAFGNGANTPSNQGAVVHRDAELIAGGLSMRSGSATVGIYVNGAKVFDIVSQAPVERVLRPIDPVISLNAGDVIGFQTVTASGTSSPNQVMAFLRGR